MALLSKSELSNIVGQNYKSTRFAASLKKSVSDEIDNQQKKYDIFLSHSYLDKETIFQVNYLLEEIFGFTVYVYWIEGEGVDRSEVTPATAARLRNVMDRCASLIYAVSVNASTSKWMPWELGYSDARHGRVAVLPIADNMLTASAYREQEFVGLYPYIDIAKENGGNTNKFLWVNSPVEQKTYVRFDYWMIGNELTYYP